MINPVIFIVSRERRASPVKRLRRPDRVPQLEAVNVHVLPLGTLGLDQCVPVLSPIAFRSVP